MSGGWADSDRRERLPPNWRQIRRDQLDLDDHRCTWRLPSGARCPRRATEVDHKLEKVDSHRVGIDLQSLCSTHHGKKTAVAAYRLKKAKKAKAAKKVERHPGNVR